MPKERSGGGGPPTMIMQAYREMDEGDQNRLEKMGYGMITLVAVVIVFGIFYDFAIPYLVLVSGFGLIGVCFVFPALGAWALDLFFKLTIALIPSLRPRLRPDPRDRTNGEDK